MDLEIVKQEIHPNQTLEYDVSEERLDELFDHFDADDSGQISLEEFDAGLNALGLGDKLTIDELRRIVAYADDSMDGYIDRSEFSAVIQYIYKEVNQGCKVTASLMNGGKAWNAPHKGLVKMKMDVQHMYNSKYECLTQQQLTNIFSTVEGNAQAGDLLQFAMENTRLKTAEAHALYAALQRETGAPEKAMAAVLARAAAPRYARVLLDAVFPRNSVERKRLRQLLGPTLLPLIGLHVGHYSLDLSEKADRETFKQVVEMNHYEAEISKKVCRFDTSQTRDWKNFRNVRLNGEAFKLKKAFMACPPPSGTLAFDYVETTRPGQCTFLSLPHGRTEDHRFLRLLQEAGVIAEEEAMEAGEAASLGALVAARGAPRYARTRSTYMEICKMYGDVLPNPKDHPKSDYTRPNLLPQRSGDGDGLLTPVAVQSHSPATGRQSSLSRKGSGAAGGDGEPNAAARPRSRVGSMGGSRGSMGGSRRRGRAASRSGAGAGGVRVFRGRALRTRRLVRRAATLSEEDVLFETKYLLAGRYFSAEQVQYLLTVFPARGRAALADVAVAAFPRVADLWRFGEVMEVLPPKVQAELVARLGILNVWSPLNPDGYLEVDFSRPEERQLGRALFHLCSLEPGAGLQGLSFQWSRLDPVIPGWKLLEMHQTEDGFPAKGVLSTWYVSGDWASSGGDGGSGDSRAPLQRAPLANAAAGLGGRGARPHANLRRALARCVVLGGTPSIDANDEPASPHPPGEPDELVNEVIRREGFMLRYDGQYRRQNSSMEQDGEEQEEK